MSAMIEPLMTPRCELAENPLWRGDDGCLLWTDIPAGRIHRLHVATGAHDVIYDGEPVGGFTFQEDGALLLFRVRDIALLRANGQIRILRGFCDEGMERFNDVIADPEGRVYAGTIGTTAESGGLYRVDPCGTVTNLFRGTGCSNGMGFSPDLRTFYWTCSTRRRLYAFDYDRATGLLSRERILHQAGAAGGIPDGMTVDRDGHIWSARWDGFAIVQHAPDGTVLSHVRLPVARVTALCLGGPALDEFYVTTASASAGGSREERKDGRLFRVRLGVQGRPPFRSRI